MQADATKAPEQNPRLPGCLSCVGSAKSDLVVIHENGHDGYQCHDCNLIYVSPRPDPDNIVNLYDHDSAQVSAQELIDSYSSLGKALKARFTLKQIRHYRPSGRLLEIGPGGGAFLREARKHYSVHAAEFNPAQVAHLKKVGVDCRHGSFSGEFRGESFDVIYFCDVLSHLFDPIKELRSMRAMLNPGGIVVLETGNNGDISRKYDSLVDRWQYPDHLYFFSQASLENLAQASGFRIESRRAYSRVVEMALDNKLKSAKTAAKGSRGVSTSEQGFKRRLIRQAMSMKHSLDYFLIYRLGAVLPKRGRPQTLIVILKPA